MAPKTKRKRTHAQIRVDVPQQDAIVTRVEVSRGANQQILTRSTKVSIAVAPLMEHGPFQGSEASPPPPDDESAPAPKKARKGPSHSVTV